MRPGRPGRVLIAGVGIAVVALTLAACGNGTTDPVAADSPGFGQVQPADQTGNASASDASALTSVASDLAPSDTVGVEQVGSSGVGDGGFADSTVAGGSIRAGLAGRDFVSTSVTGFTPAPGSEIHIAFPSADQISINAGCNNLFGQIDWDGAELTVPQLASTMMACEPALMEQDTFLTTLLASGVTASLSGDALTLTQGDVTIELVEQQAPLVDDMNQLDDAKLDPSISDMPARIPDLPAGASDTQG